MQNELLSGYKVALKQQTQGFQTANPIVKSLREQLKDNEKRLKEYGESLRVAAGELVTQLEAEIKRLDPDQETNT